MRVKQLVLLTISSGPHGTTVYVDGKVSRSDPHFRIHLADLYRRLVLGTSPSNYQVWHGRDSRSCDFRRGNFSRNKQRRILPDGAAACLPLSREAGNPSHTLARYDFSERNGNVAHSEIVFGPPLMIPRRFLCSSQAVACVADRGVRLDTELARRRDRKYPRLHAVWVRALRILCGALARAGRRF